MSDTESDTVKVAILLLTLIIPVLINWFANGFPTDRASLGFLVAALLTAVLAFLQRWQERKSLRKRLKVEKTKS